MPIALKRASRNHRRGGSKGRVKRGFEYFIIMIVGAIAAKFASRSSVLMFLM